MLPTLRHAEKTSICNVRGWVCALPTDQVSDIEGAEVLEDLAYKPGTPYLSFNETVRLAIESHRNKSS